MEITKKPFIQTSSQQGVTSSVTGPIKPPVETEFTTFLRGVVTPDSANKVSEEDLFSALVQQRIKNSKGDDVLKKFQETLTQTKESMKKGDGYVPVEDATKAALIKSREAGLISKEETDKIYSESFAAAQLDDNKEILYDGRGGGNDPTIAVAAFDQAMMVASGLIDKFDDGSLTATIRSVEEASNGKMAGDVGGHSESGGSGGFLFKPVADTNGKLVVLMPSKLAGMVAGVKLYDPAGTLLESGRYTGNGNGGRDHYRFKRTGGDYPDGLFVEATLSTGDKVVYHIKETSQRTENISPVNNMDDSSSTDSSGSSEDTSDDSGEYDGSSTDTPSTPDDNPGAL
jgi:hypothetical protein